MSDIPVRGVKIQGERSINYRRIVVAGLFGNISPLGLEAIVYSQERLPEKVLETEPLSLDKVTLKRTAECDLIIDPLEMKSIYEWLGRKIVEYEKVFGEIPSSTDLEKRLGVVESK
ncbi:MAG: hypothetical protein K0S93_2358 [Nitrososphaeraceae archaeon]|jgi:hypothetical protein|nr:hypothetical protein [Nitrososphaeraceae archaeon]